MNERQATADFRYSWLEDARVASQLAATEALIAQAATDGNRPLRFHRQLLARRSKRLRPALLLLVARFGREVSDDRLVRAAAAIEQVHEGTLYHDDIVDSSVTRRGQPTVSAACGPGVAGFAGSELIYRGALLCADMPPAARTQLVRTARTLCCGQARELEYAGDEQATVRRRLEVMSQKTASLFRLAAGLGAIVSGVKTGHARALQRYAVRFGFCFQLADDLRDLRTGRGASCTDRGSDVRDAVYTLPVLYALQSQRVGSEQLADALRALRRQNHEAPESEALERRAVELVDRLGGAIRARSVLVRWRDAAKAELHGLPADLAIAARVSLENLLEEVIVLSRGRDLDGAVDASHGRRRRGRNDFRVV